MMKNKNLVVVLLLIVVAIFVAVYFFWLRPTTKPSSPTPIQPATIVDPTLPPEQLEIMANVINHEVKVSQSSITPRTITVKLYDQIQFYNETADKEIRVVGEEWGNIPLKPGENMTKSFTQAGTYAYQIDELGLSGEVIVE